MSKNRRNVSGIVFDFMEEKIMSREWQPGMKIMSEAQLAAELKVSRMSVREAIEQMVALSILTKKQGEGTFVNSLKPDIYLNSLIPMIILDRDNFMSMFEFRLIIEVESARLCAMRATPEIINSLLRAEENIIRNKDNNEKFIDSDWIFHRIIAQGTGNSLIRKVSKVLGNFLSYHQKIANKTLGPENTDLVFQEHRNIVKAISDADPELSGIYMRRHMERIIGEIAKIDYDNIAETEVE